MTKRPRKRRTLTPTTEELRFPAIEVRQGPHRTLYSFAVDGKLLPRFATVSRLHRSSDQELAGYQRPEVFSHINEIREYIESEDPMIPNAIVIAFDPRVRFEGADVQALRPTYTRVGVLVIPIDPEAAPEDLPGWIVDGQQRAAAIRDAEIDRFPICVTAFITGSAHQQREQFILVNSTKPLPKGLIYELLPSTEARLPSTLERRRFPAYLVDRLNHDEESPLRGMIQTHTVPDGVVKDNSVLKMLENSLTDGALYHARHTKTGERDAEAMLDVLYSFWSAVEEVFPGAWGRKPSKSRLMHGAGFVAMGFVMDAISLRYRRDGGITKERCVANLKPLRPICHWTAGTWTFPSGVVRRWDEVQNTPKDIQLLSDYLRAEFAERVWRRGRSGRATAAG